MGVDTVVMSIFSRNEYSPMGGIDDSSLWEVIIKLGHIALTITILIYIMMGGMVFHENDKNTSRHHYEQNKIRIINNRIAFLEFENKKLKQELNTLIAQEGVIDNIIKHIDFLYNHDVTFQSMLKTMQLSRKNNHHGDVYYPVTGPKHEVVTPIVRKNVVKAE